MTAACSDGQPRAVLHRGSGLLAPVERRCPAAACLAPEVQEMRSRFAEAQQRQSEVLRMAQDGRLDAGGHLGLCLLRPCCHNFLLAGTKAGGKRSFLLRSQGSGAQAMPARCPSSPKIQPGSPVRR